jgi:hypothetical protein
MPRKILPPKAPPVRGFFTTTCQEGVTYRQRCQKESIAKLCCNQNTQDTTKVRYSAQLSSERTTFCLELHYVQIHRTLLRGTPSTVAMLAW